MGGDDSSTGLNSDAFREAGRVIFESQMTSNSVASQQERTTAASQCRFESQRREFYRMEEWNKPFKCFWKSSDYAVNAKYPTQPLICE